MIEYMDPSEYAALADPAASAAEAFEERAAIMEFQGGMTREAAETAARADAAKFNHLMNLYMLRMQAIRLAAKKRSRRR